MSAPDREGVPPAALVEVRRRFVTLTALRWFPTGVVIPVMVLLMRERGLDLATIGLLGAVYSVVTLALELPTGGLADVVGRRPILVASSALSVVALLVLAAGPTALALGVGYAVFGAARALDSGPLQAWYVDAVHAINPEADLTPGLARAGVAESLGLGVGALVGGAVVAVSPLPTEGALFIALSTPFLVAGAITGLQLVMVLVWVDEPPREHRATVREVAADVPRTIRRGVGLAVRRGVLRRVMVFTVALGVALAGIELLAPNAFADLLGGEAAAAAPYAVLVTLGFAGSALGSALAPVVRRAMRADVRGVVVAAVLGGAALMALAVPVFGVAAAAFVAFYIFLGIGGPLVESVTHRAVTSAERATVLSASSMSLQAGGVVASLGLGALAGAMSVAVGFVTAGVVLAVGGLVFLGGRSVGAAEDPATR